MERVERIELSSKGWKPLIIAIIRHPLKWWVCLDLNQDSADYESDALTNYATDPSVGFAALPSTLMHYLEFGPNAVDL